MFGEGFGLARGDVRGLRASRLQDAATVDVMGFISSATEHNSEFPPLTFLLVE